MRNRINKQTQAPVLQASTKDYGVMNSRIHSLTNETKSDIARTKLISMFGV